MAVSTGQTTTTFVAAMKEYYLEGLEDQTQKQSFFLNRLQRNTENVEGKYAYIA